MLSHRDHDQIMGIILTLSDEQAGAGELLPSFLSFQALQAYLEVLERKEMKINARDMIVFERDESVEEYKIQNGSEKQLREFVCLGVSIDKMVSLKVILNGSESRKTDKESSTICLYW